MQSVMSITRAAYRIVFRGGTPQRIHFSGPVLLSATFTFIIVAIISQRLLYSSGIIPIGLFLFTTLTGLYIAAALLTRTVARAKLRLTLQAVMILLAFSQLVLLLSAPAAAISYVRISVTALVLIGLFIGMTNCLQFATGGRRSTAATQTLLFAAGLGGFYAIMLSLLQTLYG
jgi:hypothetical protein